MKHILILFIHFLVHTNSLNGNTYAYSTNKIPKYNEDLDRGVVAINSKAKEAFISWRFLITDDDDISFNLYREEVANDSDSNITIKLNTEPISKVTYFRDGKHDIKKEYNYFVGTIINSSEIENSTKYTLKANLPVIPCYRIPIHSGCQIRTVWPGDLNGDGKFDFVLARNCDLNQKVEAYLSDGTFLWQIDLGHNSYNKDNIKPGATTVNVGHWDGVNVYDLNGDGKAEVFIRIANNVTFGDGFHFLNEGHEENYEYLDSEQWIACIDGMTGKLLTKVQVPTKYVQHGPMAAQFGVGYLDGVKPSLVSVLKNRDKRNNFHMIVAAFSFNEKKEFAMDWYWARDDEPNHVCHDGHHFRLADSDMDGKDEVHEIGFALNGDGKLRYDIGKNGIGHGDRFYVGRYNKDDSTMMGYGVQQYNTDNVTEYYYNASSGEVLWKHYHTDLIDNGRGNIGDFDPYHPGLEVYSFFGMYNAKTNEMVFNDTKSLWPSNNIFWDGTLVPACVHEMTVNKWNADKGYAERLFTPYSIYNKVFGEYPTADQTYPLFHGDIIGDWREEFIVTTKNYDQLVIFTTDYDTDYRITSLSQDPGMRNSMTLNGYKQSHMSLMYMATDMDVEKERSFIKKYMAERAIKSNSIDDLQSEINSEKYSTSVEENEIIKTNDESEKTKDNEE
ncbi:hypothetical protein M9Y10_018900 [Tritrichomonas musculus]|uniref:Rhamnogalacturonan I lyase beta-sheet domain-containing protein n=1 Tax=Tritrichomonas musculus TaxID=1915356 RepID=A0ABR2HI18_9EUKA